MPELIVVVPPYELVPVKLMVLLLALMLKLPVPEMLLPIVVSIFRLIIKLELLTTFPEPRVPVEAPLPI